MFIDILKDWFEKKKPEVMKLDGYVLHFKNQIDQSETKIFKGFC